MLQPSSPPQGAECSLMGRGVHDVEKPSHDTGIKISISRQEIKSRQLKLLAWSYLGKKQKSFKVEQDEAGGYNL